MNTHSLDLSFVDDRASNLPHPPVAEIYVKTFWQRVPNGVLLITTDCVSSQELDWQIDRLHQELEAIRKEGHRKFAEEWKRFEATVRPTQP